MKTLYEYGTDLLPTLQEYSVKGLVSLRKHPDFDLWVSSYTAGVPFAKAWDEITLQTRCIMVDKNGLVAKSFDKFFNVGEVDFVGGVYHATDKVDGSLILAVKYEDQIVVSSKSSFTSDHAREAQKLISKLMPHTYGTVFELTHPDYRIVLDYGTQPRLTYLGGVIDPTLPFAELNDGNWCGFDIPEQFTVLLSNQESALSFAQDYEGIEGFILTSVGNKRLKYKLKTPWYLERHRVIFGLSPQRIFEVAKKGNYRDFIISLPDEFQDDITKQINEHLLQFEGTKQLVEGIAAAIGQGYPSRKEYAALVHEHPKNLHGMLFSAYEDGRVSDKLVWKAIEP